MITNNKIKNCINWNLIRYSLLFCIMFASGNHALNNLRLPSKELICINFKPNILITINQTY